jgi:flavorubredoxin
VREDGLEISLGNKTLRLIQTPWLHWPETMSTYLVEDKILFSCDAFGSFRKLPQNALFESEAGSTEQHISDSRKYFASVFNVHREWVLNAIDKLDRLNVDINVLAPSHGPVYVVNAKEMMKLWGSWSQGHFKKTVVIAYGSMYGITKKCIEAISNGITEAGGSAIAFNLSEEFPINVLSALVEAPALIVGSPTYEHEMFPKVKDFLNLLSTKKFSSRVAGAFGSFGWSGEAMRKVSAELTGLGFEMAAEPLAFFGSPTKEDLEKAKQLGRMVAEKAFTLLNSINV